MRFDQLSCNVVSVETTLYNSEKETESVYAFPYMYSKQDDHIKDFVRTLNLQFRTKGHLLINFFDKKLVKFIKKNYKDAYQNLIKEDRDKLSKNTNLVLDIVIKSINNENREFNKFEQCILNIVEYIDKEKFLGSAWFKTSCDYNDGLFESNSIRDNFYMFKENIYMIFEYTKHIDYINKLANGYISESNGNKKGMSNREILFMVIESYFERILLFLNTPLDTVGSYLTDDMKHRVCYCRETASDNDLLINFFAESDVLRFYETSLVNLKFHVYDEVINFDKFKIYIPNRFDDDGTAKY